MAIPQSFSRLISDPAPGLVFPAHERAGVGERAYFTPHRVLPPTSAKFLAVLHGLARREPTKHHDLVEFYTRFGGAELFTLSHPRHGDAGAVLLLPVHEWDEATSPYAEGDMVWAIEDCPLYRSGLWRVFAMSPPGGISYVTFLDGVYEGEPLAGRIYALGLGGVLGYEELLAQSFGNFLDQIAVDPVGFFNKVGIGGHIDVGDGKGYGDPIGEYVSDVRTHQSFQPWPGKA